PLRGLLRRGPVCALRDEDQLVEDRRRGRDIVVVAVEGLRVEAAFDDPAGDQLGNRLDTALEDVGQGCQPDREAPGVATAEAMLGRGSDMEDRLAIELVGVSATDREDPARRELTRCGEGRGEA